MRSLFMSFMLVLMVVSGEAAMEKWIRNEMVELSGYGEEKLSSVLLTASLLSSSSSPIHGGIVGIKCQMGKRKRSKWIKGVTDEFGQLELDLPSQLHAIHDLDKACIIKLLSVPKPYRCSSKIHKGIQLLSSSNGSRVYTAGNITLE